MKKFLKVSVIIVGILFILLLLAPLLFKNQLVTQVKKVANRQLNATLNFDNDISLSFIRNFPNASLRVRDLSIIGKGEYDGDTLAYIKNIRLVIDLSSLFGGKAYRIKNVVLQKPYVQLLVDGAGRPNWDIMLPDTGTAVSTPSTFKAALQRYAISDGHLVFADTAARFFLEAKDLDHTGTGDFTQDVFDLDTHSDAGALTIAYGGIPYLDGIHTDISAAIHIDLPQSKYTLKNNSVKLNGLIFGINGFVDLSDSSNVRMDLSFKSSEGKFKNFLSLIPALYQKDFDKLKASGTMAFNGFVKGTYDEHTIPSFKVQLKVNNGMFQYPDVPESLKDVNLDVTAQNGDGNVDHTVIDVKQLRFRMGDNPFDAHMTIQNPTTDPLIDGAVKGKLNLSDVSKVYPLDQGTVLSGILDLDVRAKGRLSAAEENNYQQFSTQGQALAQNISYKSSSFPEGISIPGGTLTFSPQKVNATNISVHFGKSDLMANGQLDNLFGYLFGKDHLKGSLLVNSHLLNLNELMSDQPASTDTTSDVKVVRIPENIDFSLDATIDHFIYDNYDLTNVRGNLRMANGILTFNNIQANGLGGSMGLSGSYDTRKPETPKTDLSLKVNNIDIQQAFKTFNTVKALAPIAAFAHGSFSGDIDLSTLLNNHLFAILPSLNSTGKITIPDLNIKGFKPMQEIASTVGIPELRQPNLDKLSLSYFIDSGFLKVKPFDFSIAGINITAAGQNGLNQAIDYALQMRVPRSRLGDANTALNNLVNQANKLSGTDAKVDSMITVGVLLGGSMTHPTVKLDLSEQKAQLEKNITSTVAQKLKQEKSSVLNRLLSKDSSTKKSDTASSRPVQTLKQNLQKGIKGLFNQKKDNGE